MCSKINLATLPPIGIVATTAWFAFRLPNSYQNPSASTNAPEIRETVNRTKEKQKPENEEAQCLRAQKPNLRRLVYFGVFNLKAIEIPKPEYPAEAKAPKISGEVQAGAVIDETGKVIWARVETGHPLLQAAVKKVVCQARFKPVTISEIAVAVQGIITYKFMLD